MYFVLIVNSDDVDRAPKMLGPFNSVQQANGRMREAYDGYLEDAGDVDESDDSDGDHFFILANDTEVHFYIVEPSFN